MTADTPTPDDDRLYPKYHVTKRATGEEVFDCIVLKFSDRHACRALRYYAEEIEREQPGIARGIREALDEYPGGRSDDG